MTRVNDRTASKTARKQEHLELQALGEQLIGLPACVLETLDLDPTLVDAIVDAGSMRAHGALRRQRQLIGKLMRHADAERIRAGLAALRRTDREANAVLHAAERWRERLCDEGAPALAELARRTRRPVDQIAAVLRELESADAVGRRRLRRRLFREVHALLQSSSMNEEEKA
ncbi:MAG TPA: ribosome biogenesis factor YjgA [Woeseiaceae bacterium]